MHVSFQIAVLLCLVVFCGVHRPVNKGDEEALQAEKKRLEHERRARQQASGGAGRDMGQELAGHCGERMEGKWSCCHAQAEDAPPCLRSSVRGIRCYIDARFG